jgi:hypothetical protein
MGIRPPNYTQVPNEHLDNLQMYTDSELRLLLALDRLTFGYHRVKVRKSLTNLMKLTGLSRQGLLNAAARLEKENEQGRPAVVVRHQDGGVTEWEMLMEVEDEDGTAAPKAQAAAAPKSKPDTQPNHLLPLAQAIAQVTCTDLQLMNKRIFAEAKKLDGRYTVEQVLEAFEKDTGKWYLYDWRGQQNSPPTISQVRSEISRVLLLQPVPGREGGQAPPRRQETVKKDGSGFYV